MIVISEGSADSGYDLFATSLAINDLRRDSKPIFSNNELKMIEYTRFDVEKFMKYARADVFMNCSILFIDAYSFMDSRMHMSNINRLVAYVACQSRRKDINVYIATQNFMDVDKRIRNMVNVRAFCSNIGSKNIISVTKIIVDSNNTNTDKVDLSEASLNLGFALRGVS